MGFYSVDIQVRKQEVTENLKRKRKKIWLKRSRGLLTNAIARTDVAIIQKLKGKRGFGNYTPARLNEVKKRPGGMFINFDSAE